MRPCTPLDGRQNAGRYRRPLSVVRFFYSPFFSSRSSTRIISSPIWQISQNGIMYSFSWPRNPQIQPGPGTIIARSLPVQISKSTSPTKPSRLQSFTLITSFCLKSQILTACLRPLSYCQCMGTAIKGAHPIGIFSPAVTVSRHHLSSFQSTRNPDSAYPYNTVYRNQNLFLRLPDISSHEYKSLLRHLIESPAPSIARYAACSNA